MDWNKDIFATFAQSSLEFSVLFFSSIDIAKSAVCSSYKRKARPRAETRVVPQRTLPTVLMLDLLKPLAKSKTRWRMPLTQWPMNGQARRNLKAPLAATGRAPKAAAMEADSRCQPSRGATR